MEDPGQQSAGRGRRPAAGGDLGLATAPASAHLVLAAPGFFGLPTVRTTGPVAPVSCAPAAALVLGGPSKARAGRILLGRTGRDKPTGGGGR